MKILEKGIMSNGTKIQIEDWSKSYSFASPGDTLAAYATSKISIEDPFAPKKGKLYRFAFKFNSLQETRKAYTALIKGEKMLSDYRINLYRPEYINCI